MSDIARQIKGIEDRIKALEEAVFKPKVAGSITSGKPSRITELEKAVYGLKKPLGTPKP